jgi:hypothetical protein
MTPDSADTLGNRLVFRGLYTVTKFGWGIVLGAAWIATVYCSYSWTVTDCRRAASCPGGAPNMRRYSRLNCDGLR